MGCQRGEDTVSKIDTKNNKEVARYRTWFGPKRPAGLLQPPRRPWSGPAPSRTAVDKDGNAYVLNRHFEGRPAVLLKILASGGIDRNGNGVIDTSLDANDNGTIDTAEIIPLADSNSNGVLDQRTGGRAHRLERFASVPARQGWAGPVHRHRRQPVGRPLQQPGLLQGQGHGRGHPGRADQHDTDAGHAERRCLDPYGCLIDGQGNPVGRRVSTRPWARSLTPRAAPARGPYRRSTGLLQLASPFGTGRTMVYLATPGNPDLRQFSSATNTFTNPTPPSSRYSTSGIVVDGAEDVVTGPYGSGGLVSTSPTAPSRLDRPTQFSGETRGVIPDRDNNLWQRSAVPARAS